MSRVVQIQVELDSGETRKISAALENHSLADILAAHGLPLNTRCGQRGLCRGCEVELREGSATVDGKTVATPATIKACRAQLTGNLAVHLPARSRIEHRPQVGETF